jgi:RNA polymerase sigma-70 factor (ECF subfamily)
VVLASLSALEPRATAIVRPTVRELFDAHSRFVWHVLGAHGVASAELEDATQEVFLTAHQRMADWEPARASARTWLYAIAVRIAANLRRRAHRSQPELPPAQPIDPAVAAERAKTAAKLKAALDGLSAQHREVFVLFEIEELPMKQVAEAIGCPLKTAYGRLYEARHQLAAALGEGHKP